MRTDRRRLLAVACVAAALGPLAACSTTQPPDERTATLSAVTDLTAPVGWTTGPVQPACVTVNLDCQDVSVRRVFTSSSAVAAACASMTSWASGTAAFGSPTAIVGTDVAAPVDPTTCRDEMTRYTRYTIRAKAAADLPSSASWALRLTPKAGGGYELSATLGDPPATSFR
jgi:hypothetical protein